MSAAIFKHVCAGDERTARPNSRRGIPNGSSKHYGNRDERHKLDVDVDDAMKRLVTPSDD